MQTANATLRIVQFNYVNIGDTSAVVLEGHRGRTQRQGTQARLEGMTAAVLS